MNKQRDCKKKKLLIVSGAGASKEFGFPLSTDVDPLLFEASKQYFHLASEPSGNLYSFIRDKVKRYHDNCGDLCLKKR